MTTGEDNRIAFEALVTPHLDAMLRTAQRLTKDGTEAEDLVQEAMLKGYRFFERFERDSNFKAWIFKILMNAFVNNYRQKKRRGPTVDVDILADALPHESGSNVADNAESFGAREAAVFELVDDRIRQALMELPEHLRIVFMLNVVEDLKYREIADVLDCPVGTVMSRLFRARAMLKERLEHFAEMSGLPQDRGE